MQAHSGTGPRSLNPVVNVQPVSLSPLRWSEPKLAALHTAASDSVPLARDVARCKLAAWAGDFTAASAIVEDLTAQFAQREDLFFVHVLSTVAVIAGRTDIAARLIAARLGEGWQIEVRLIRAMPGRADFVQWSVTADRQMRFDLNGDLFANDLTEHRLDRWIYLLPLYLAYARRDPLETGSVPIYLGDLAGAPGLGFCSAHPDTFLIPDPVFLTLRAYKGSAEAYRQTDIAWEQRAPVAFWRGTTTGQPTEPALGWRSLPRVRLCEIARQHPAFFDAGIAGVTQFDDPAVREDITNSGLIRPFVPADQFNRYRYQIDIDGNTNSWPGLFQKLLTGSPVLKIASARGYRQWYYDRLRPWINIIPVAADMSDLVEKLEWLRNHDSAARAIGAAGRELAESLTYESEVQRAADTAAAAFRHLNGTHGLSLMPTSLDASRPDQPPPVASLQPHITTIDEVSHDPATCAVRQAMQLAMAGEGKLSRDILAMQGMSGRKYRLFINNLLEALPSPRYLEIGVWAGSTLCSAIWQNRLHATAIDNWSEFGGPKAQFEANLARFRTPGAEVRFLESDFRSVNFAELGRHSVFLFDGPHDPKDQFDGIATAMPALDDRFILIVDDWNWPGPRLGTMRALRELRLRPRYALEIRTTLDDTPGLAVGANSDWHNGYFIAVLEKPD